MSAMNWADFIVLGVIALSVLIGLWRGLVSEAMALVTWIAAFWVAWELGPSVAAYFRDLIELPSARVLVGYGLCFLAVLLLGALVRFVLSRLVEGTGLTGTDRLLGMIFGFARGVLLVTVAVFLLGFTPLSRDPWWQHSVLLGQAQDAADWLAQRLPDDVRRYVHPQHQQAPGSPHFSLPTHVTRAMSAKLSGSDPLSSASSDPAPAATRMRPAAVGQPGTNTSQE